MNTEISIRAPVAAWRSWLGAAALLLALLGLAAFVSYFSVVYQPSKALVYGSHDFLTAAYFNLPTVSPASAMAAVVLSIVAMLGTPRALNSAFLGLGISVVGFVAMMAGASSAVLALAPNLYDGNGGGAVTYLAFAPSPPAIGMLVALIGVAAFIRWRRNLAGRRAAAGALIVGGMVAAYWLLSFFIMSFSGG